MEPIVTVGICVAAAAGVTVGIMTYREWAFRRRYAGRIVKLVKASEFKKLRARPSRKLLSQLDYETEGLVVGFTSGLYVAWNRRVQIKKIGSNTVKEYALSDFTLFDLVDETEDMLEHIEGISTAALQSFSKAAPAMREKMSAEAVKALKKYEKSPAKTKEARDQATAEVLHAQFEALADVVDMSELRPEILKLLSGAKKNALRGGASEETVDVVNTVLTTGIELGVNNIKKGAKVAASGEKFKKVMQSGDDKAIGKMVSGVFATLFGAPSPASGPAN